MVVATRTARRRTWAALLVILSGALLVAMATPAAATAEPTQWHRLTPAEPLHERLRCVAHDGEWRCKYDSQPEPTLGMANGEVKATFTGTDVTATWQCPAWSGFPTQLCDSALRVVSGSETFVFTGGDDPFPAFTVEVDLIFEADGTLWVHWARPIVWIGDFVPFVCPWYPTFEQSLASSADCYPPPPES
jgi:hypothetical protein